MVWIDTSVIKGWHAHVYYDEASRAAALILKQEIERRFHHVSTIGRMHERPLGPHPVGSYLIAFGRSRFIEIFEWLTLNHGSLDVFIHPNTGNALSDHRDRAVWIGNSQSLALAALT